MEISGPFFEEVNALGIEVIEYPFTSFYNRNALRQYRSLARLIKERKIQLVHCHDFYSNIFGTISARLAGLKAIITSRRNRGVMFSLPQRLVQRVAYSFSAAIIANSEAARAVLLRTERVPARKVRRIYNCVDTEWFSPRAPSALLAQSLGLAGGAPVVGIVGTLRPVKGHATFVRAAAEIHKARPDVRFLIVGEGPVRDELDRLAADLGVAGAIVFAGVRTDIPDLLALIDVLALPSRSESLPNAVLEAMACGRPVVATRVGGTPELVADGETGFLVEPEDFACLARQILRVLNDPALAARMGAAARRKAVGEFSSARLIENVESLYIAVLQTRAG
jgi:glycosyltransferase involved in cell wall biosynthesis